MTKILLVEDEIKIAQVLQKYLNADGFETHIIGDGAQVTSWVKAHQPDFILLDIMLPNKDGVEICRDIRSFSNVPIIMVTARVEEIDRLLGLALGADDYICKPFSPKEVVARVKAVLRRVAASSIEIESDALHFQINHENYQASLNNTLLDLTPVEFRILVAFEQSPNRIWSRLQLLDVMYTDHRAVSDRTVDSHVANLRKKLQAIKSDCEFIHAVYGVGYRFELTVS